MNVVIVASREQVERGPRIGGSFVLISIIDPGAPTVVLPPRPLPLAVLRLAFDDALPGDQPPDEGQSLQFMTEQDARAIWNFVNEHRDADTLVVQCEAGWSRSSAVAAAIAPVLDEEAEKYFRDYSPNEYVFRMMLRAMPDRLRPRSR